MLWDIYTLWNTWDNWKDKGFEIKRWDQVLGEGDSINILTDKFPGEGEKGNQNRGSRNGVSDKSPIHSHSPVLSRREQLNVLKTYYCDTNLSSFNLFYKYFDSTYLCARGSSKQFTNINSCNLYNKPMKQVLALSSFYQEWDWDPQRLNNLPKVPVRK